MKLFMYDLETTGTNPGKHGIHQISGKIIIEGLCTDIFNFKVQPNPLAKVEQEALDTCKVTYEQIMAYQPMQEVYTQFIELIGRRVGKYDKTDKFHLIGYNNRKFDDDFLRGFFKQNGDEYFGSWFWADSIDVMVLASWYLADKRHKMKDFKLKTVCEFLGIEVDHGRLHDALYDIELTEKLFYTLNQLIT